MDHTVAVAVLLCIQTYYRLYQHFQIYSKSGYNVRVRLVFSDSNVLKVEPLIKIIKIIRMCIVLYIIVVNLDAEAYYCVGGIQIFQKIRINGFLYIGNCGMFRFWCRRMRYTPTQYSHAIVIVMCAVEYIQEYVFLYFPYKWDVVLVGLIGKRFRSKNMKFDQFGSLVFQIFFSNPERQFVQHACF